MLIQISSSSQFREVFKEQKTNDSPVYLYFYADWSGPSRMITPSFEDIAGDEKNEMVFLEVDAASCSDIAKEYSVKDVPTFITTLHGNTVETASAVTVKKIQEMVKGSK